MIEELILEGNKYKGRFSANQEGYLIGIGSEYIKEDESAYFYRGKGLITKIDSNEKIRFSLKTKDLFDSSIPFEEYMIWIHDKGFRKVNNSFIVNKVKVIDLVLSLMYNKAKEELKGKETVPFIKTPRLNYEELVERGLVADESNQIKLGLGSQPTH